MAYTPDLDCSPELGIHMYRTLRPRRSSNIVLPRKTLRAVIMARPSANKANNEPRAKVDINLRCGRSTRHPGEHSVGQALLCLCRARTPSTPPKTHRPMGPPMKIQDPHQSHQTLLAHGSLLDIATASTACCSVILIMGATASATVSGVSPINSRKRCMVRMVTQFPSQGQWWSKSSRHVPHIEQW